MTLEKVLLVMSNEAKIWEIICRDLAIMGCVAVIFLGFFTIQHNIQQGVQDVSRVRCLEKESDSKLQQEKNKYHQNYQKYKNLAAQKAYLNKDQKVKDYYGDLNEDKLLKQRSQKFFTIYLSWSNSHDYKQRSHKLNKIITPQLAQDKNIFDDGKDVTGNNIIKNLGLHSRLNDLTIYSNSQMPPGKEIALVKVVQESWRKGANPGLSNSLYLLRINSDQLIDQVVKLQ